MPAVPARGVVLIVGLLASSGCTQPANDSVLQHEDPSSDFSFSLSDCFGFEFQVDYPWLIGPGEAPEGWQFEPVADGRLETAVLLEGLTCNRISVLGFERGPVSMLFEGHSNTIPPESCMGGSWNLFWILNRLYVSDLQVASGLAQAGVPSVHASMKVTSTQDLLSNQNWLVEHNETATQSIINLTTVISVDTRPHALIERFAWENHGELVMLDVEWTNVAADVPPISEISLSPDMLMATAPASPPSVIEYNNRMEARGNLIYRGNLQCDDFT